jgi:hypothetical protein
MNLVLCRTSGSGQTLQFHAYYNPYDGVCSDDGVVCFVARLVMGGMDRPRNVSAVQSSVFINNIT